MGRLKATFLIVLLVVSSLVALAPSGAAREGPGDGPGPSPFLDIIDHRRLNATYTTRIPILDGVISPNEWTFAESSSARVSEAPPSWQETGTHITGPGIEDDQDASHVFWSMYDDEYLYFLFNCSDDSIWVDDYEGKFYRDDGIELAIDGAFDQDEDQRTDDGFEDGDTFFVPADGRDGISYSESNGNKYARIWGRNDDWFSVATNHSTYYIVEMAIKLNTISDPKPNSIVGLNTGQNDDDDGGETKEGVIRWQGLDGYKVWSNETLWGYLYLRTMVIADAGNSQVVNQGDQVFFDGTASSSNNPDWDNVAVHNWTFDYDGEEQLLTGPSPNFTFEIPGEYLVTLNVSDGTGQYDTDTVIVTVRDSEDPVAEAGADITVPQGELVWFDASGSTDNHPSFPDEGTFEWYFLYNGSVIRLYGLRVNYTFDVPAEYIVTLTVTDPSGLNKDTDKLTLTVQDTIAPVAEAGEDVTVDDGQYVTLDGTQSTDNFDIMRYDWVYHVGETPYCLTGSRPSVKFPAPGVYNVSLRVTDYDGNTDSDWFHVTVLDVTPPVADAGQVLEFNEDVNVTLKGELSFDNVGIVSFEWTISSVGGGVLANLTGKNVRYNFTQPGLYNVTLAVTDAAGLTSSDTVQYHVLDVSKPVADAGQDAQVDEDVEVVFDASGSTDNVDIESYEWKIDSPDLPPVMRSGEQFTYVFETPDVYTVTLTVTDSAGNWNSDPMTVTVMDVTPPECVPPDDVEIRTGQSVVFEGRASSDNVGVVKYEWEYELAGVPFLEEGANITRTFDAPGNFTVKLTVTDAAGNSDSGTFYVLVEDPKKDDDSPGMGALGALLALAALGLAGARTRRRR